MGAVIDQRAFDRISGYIDYGKKAGTIVVGGDYDNRYNNRYFFTKLR